MWEKNWMLRIVNECQFLYDLHTMMTTLLLPRVSKWGGDDGKKSFILTMSLTTTRQDIHHVFFILFFLLSCSFLTCSYSTHTHIFFCFKSEHVLSHGIFLSWNREEKIFRRLFVFPHSNLSCSKLLLFVCCWGGHYLYLCKLVEH